MVNRLANSGENGKNVAAGDQRIEVHKGNYITYVKKDPQISNISTTEQEELDRSPQVLKLEGDGVTLYLAKAGEEGFADTLSIFTSTCWDSPTALEENGYYPILTNDLPRALRHRTFSLGNPRAPFAHIKYTFSEVPPDEVVSRANLMRGNKLYRLIHARNDEKPVPVIAEDITRMMKPYSPCILVFDYSADALEPRGNPAIQALLTLNQPDIIGTQWYYVAEMPLDDENNAQRIRLSGGLLVERISKSQGERAKVIEQAADVYRRGFHHDPILDASSVQSQTYEPETLKMLLVNPLIEVIVLKEEKSGDIGGVFLGAMSLDRGELLNIAHTVNPQLPVVSYGGETRPIGELDDLLYTLSLVISPSVPRLPIADLSKIARFIPSACGARLLGGDVSSTFGVGGNPPIPRGNMALLGLVSSISNHLTVAAHHYCAVTV